MSNESFKYKFVIEMESEPVYLPKESRKLKDIEIECDFEGDSMMINEKGLTGKGYECIITTLCNLISDHAKHAGRQGFSEGEILGDAIKQLKRNLSDANRREPVGQTLRKRTPRSRKGWNGW